MTFVYNSSSFSKCACQSEIPAFSTKELVDKGEGAATCIYVWSCCPLRDFQRLKEIEILMI